MTTQQSKKSLLCLRDGVKAENYIACCEACKYIGYWNKHCISVKRSGQTHCKKNFSFSEALLGKFQWELLPGLVWQHQCCPQLMWQSAGESVAASLTRWLLSPLAKIHAILTLQNATRICKLGRECSSGSCRQHSAHQSYIVRCNTSCFHWTRLQNARQEVGELAACSCCYIWKRPVFLVTNSPEISQNNCPRNSTFAVPQTTGKVSRQVQDLDKKCGCWPCPRLFYSVDLGCTLLGASPIVSPSPRGQRPRQVQTGVARKRCPSRTFSDFRTKNCTLAIYQIAWSVKPVKPCHKILGDGFTTPRLKQEHQNCHPTTPVLRALNTISRSSSVSRSW